MLENYKVQKILGQGRYGHVLKCLNCDTEETVAVKLLKDKRKELSKIREIFILEKLRCLDPDKTCIVRCHEWFHRMDHTFIVFEMLDMSLHDYMSQREWAPMPLDGIRTVIKDVAKALKALKGFSLIHADLKLDNIMLVDHNRQPFRVKLIDFGLTLKRSEAKPGLHVQALWYRSPEVILGSPFTEAIDIWSLGLLMAYMLLGYFLFPGKQEYHMLRFMTDLLGEPPKRLLDKGIYTELFYYGSCITSPICEPSHGCPTKLPPSVTIGLQVKRTTQRDGATKQNEAICLQALQDTLANCQKAKDDRDLIMESVSDDDHSGLESITDNAKTIPSVDYDNIIITVVPPNICVETPASVLTQASSINSLHPSGRKYHLNLPKLL
eukprot:superscaffoldBa00001766_g11927